ncbi:MAG: ubiquitin-like domain-containing protein [Chloroflexota bacterium]
MPLSHATRSHPYLPFLLVLSLVMTALVSACRPTTQTYTIDDGGVETIVEGRFDTVAGAVAAAGITLEADDIVQPDPDAAADPDTPIQIDRATEVVVLRLDSRESYRTHQTTLADFLQEIDLSLQPGERLLADGRPLDPAEFASAAVPEQIVIDPYKTVTLVENGESRSVRTAASTVGDVLAEVDITAGPYDTITPDADSPITPEMTIIVEQAAPYRIVADGETVETNSPHTVVEEVVTDAGVTLGELDRTQPDRTAEVQPGDMIQVIRVVETFETADEPIAYETVYLPDDTMPLDTQAFTSAGSSGILRRQTRIVTENGVEITREPAGEWVEQEPVNEVISYGTQITIQTMDTPDGPIEYWRVVNMQVTSYTPTSAGKQPGEPGYGITASGVQAGKGVVAVDPTVVPFRSNVYVPGYGVAFAGDTGGGVKGRFIDLGYSDDDYEHWHGYVDVYYLTPVPSADKIRYILP